MFFPSKYHCISRRQRKHSHDKFSTTSNKARSDDLTTNENKKILQPPSLRPQKGTTCGDTLDSMGSRNFTRKHKAASLNAMFSEKAVFFFQGLHSSISADVNRKLATGLINEIPVLTWRCPQSQETNYKNPGLASLRFVISGRSFHFPRSYKQTWVAGTALGFATISERWS